jgi:hypothetical protein
MMIKLTPIDYCVFEKLEEPPNQYEDVPKDPRFDGQFDIDEDDPRFGTYCGGRFNWGMLQWTDSPDGEIKEDMLAKVHLMRMWCTTMYTQMAAGLSYSNDGKDSDTNVKVRLTEEELDTLATINNKMCKAIFDEMWELDQSFMRKKNIKKLDL